MNLSWVILEISFFSSTFKRHANFSQSVEKQTIHGAVKSNSMSSVQFERSGDLLRLRVFDDGYNTSSRSSKMGTIVDKVELLIGGSVYDTQDSVFTENIAVDTFAQNVSKSAKVHTRVFSAVLLLPSPVLFL